MLDRRIFRMVALLMVTVITRSALSDANPERVSRLTGTSIGEVVGEVDPEVDGDCLLLGGLNIVFRTDNHGSPNVGVVLTDPRGRRIGFDPLTKHAWDAFPLAQGYIDCDDPDGLSACREVLQICGPVSGRYKLEVIARQSTAYSVTISARSKEVLDGDRLQSFHSETDLNKISIGARSRDVVLLNYSRDPQQNVTAQMQRAGHAQSLQSRSHRQPHLKLSEHSVVGQEE